MAPNADQTGESPEKPSDIQPATSDDTDSPDESEESVIPPEILNKVPQGLRGQFSAFFASGQMQHPVLKNMRPQHVSDMISHVREEGKRNFISSILDRVMIIGIVLIAMAFILILLNALSDKPDMFLTILTAMLSFLGGLGIGKAWR